MSTPPSNLTSAPARRRSWLVVLCLLALPAAAFSLWFQQRQFAQPGRAAYLKGLDEATGRRFDKAIIDWRRGTEQDPAFPQNWLMLGDFYASAREWPEAARYYQTASKLLPDDGRTWLKLATAEQAAGDAKDATTAARRAAQLLPGVVEAQSLDGHLESDAHQTAAGLASMRRANALQPNDPLIVRELAQQEINVRDLAGAERDLRPYVQAHPNDPETAYLMAVIALAKPPSPANLQTGLHYAQIACAGEPTDPDCHSVLGQLYLNSRQPQQALQAYQAALQTAPNSEKLLYGVQTAYTRLGNARAAAVAAAALHQAALRHNEIRHWETMLLLSPTDLAGRLRYARLLTDDAQFRPAQIQYERCVRDFPHDPRTHPALADFLRRLGFPDAARKAARPDYIPK